VPHAMRRQGVKAVPAHDVPALQATQQQAVNNPDQSVCGSSCRMHAAQQACSTERCSVRMCVGALLSTPYIATAKGQLDVQQLSTGCLLCRNQERHRD
jgi:hypothetical protein